MTRAAPSLSPSLSLSFPSSHSLTTVTLVDAHNLHARLDTDQEPDAFALVSLDGRKMLANTLKGDHGPLWDTNFIFDTIRSESKLHITLFDNMPKQQAPRFLGKVEFDVNRLAVGKAREVTLPLLKGWREPEDKSGSPHQELQVLVRLIEAKGILAADRGGTSDPYATLEVDTQKFSSSVQKKTLKPKWRETFRFQLGSFLKQRSEEDKTKCRSLWKKARKKNAGRMSLKPEKEPGLDRLNSAVSNLSNSTMVTSFSDVLKGSSKYLTVSIWDHDMGPNPDDFLGCIVLPLHLVSEGDEFEDWFELRAGADKTQVSGMVKLGLRVTEKWDPEPVSGEVTLNVEKRFKDVAPEEIVIEVIQARDIQAADRGGTSDPFAIIAFHGGREAKGGETGKTRVIHKSLNPVWDEMFVLTKQPGAKNLIIDIFDYDRFGSNDFLGRAFVPLTDISEDAKQVWVELREKSGERDSSGAIKGEVELKVKRRAQGSMIPEEINLHVIEATGLMAADRGGTSDPFAVIRFQGSSRCTKTWKTRVIDKTLTPIWDERFVLDLEETAKTFVLDVFDDDILGGNDFLGRVSLPLNSIINGQVEHRWYPLSSMDDDATEQAEEVVVEVIEARGIKAADRGGTSDPFATVSFGGGDARLKSQKTKTIYKTLEPVWNETFVQSLDTHPEEIFVDIFDYDLVGMNDFLGRAKVQIQSLQPDSSIDEWIDLGYKNEPQHAKSAPKILTAPKNEVVVAPESSRVAEPAEAGAEAEGRADIAEAPGTARTASASTETDSLDGSQTKQVKAKNQGVLKVLSRLSDKMHELVERGLDFMRGPEEGITGSVHLRVTRRPRDLGSVHLKISRCNREPFTRVIVVNLISGRNMLAADKGGDSDPYVTLLVEGADDKKKHKSRVIDNNNVDPQWNQTFRIATRGELGQLLMHVYDHNKVSKHELLGVAALDLKIFLQNPDKIFDDWLPLTGVNKKLGAATGELRVRVGMELEEILPPAAPPPKRKLQVVVLEARDLQAADRGGTSDPFTVAHVGGVKPIKTKVIKKTLCPKWNETLHMTLPAGNEEPLKVQVYDHDQFGTNDFLGEIVMPLYILEMGEVIDKWYDLEPREGRDEVVSGSIHLQVTMTPEE